MNPNNQYDPNTPPSVPVAPPIQPATPTAAPADPQNYLDAIADKPEKARFLSKKMLFLIAGALFALIIVIVISVIVNNAKQAATSEITTLNTKLGDLQTVLRYSQSNPHSDSKIVQVTTETSVVAASHQNELAKVYDSISNANTSSAPNKSITDELDDAKSRGSLDSAYTTTLREQLLAVCSQLEILYNSAKTDQQKTVLQAAYDDFQELASRLPSSSI
jgi:hypothetical protein